MQALLERLFNEPHTPHLEKFIALSTEKSRTLEAVQKLRVSRENYLIRNFDIEIQWAGDRRGAHGEILPLEAPAPRSPAEVDRNSLPEVSLGTLFFNLNSLGGWSNHGLLTQSVIDLVKGSEINKPKIDQLYAELYDSGWYSDSYSEADDRAGLKAKLGKTHHPLVVGAINEDSTDSLKPEYDTWFNGDNHFQADSSFYYQASGYKRYYHHFGGEGIGLEDKWYFVFEGPPKTTNGNRSIAPAIGHMVMGALTSHSTH